MNNTSILTQPGLTTLGVVTEPPTNWSDCFPLDCLTFDDANITQAHIDMAAARMAEASDNNFLRWISLDRGFKADYTAFKKSNLRSFFPTERGKVPCGARVAGRVRPRGCWFNSTAPSLKKWVGRSFGKTPIKKRKSDSVTKVSELAATVWPMVNLFSTLHNTPKRNAWNAKPKGPVAPPSGRTWTSKGTSLPRPHHGHPPSGSRRERRGQP